MAPQRRAATVFIFITVMLDMLALGVIIPVLPTLVEGFLDGDTAKASRLIGLFSTVWAAMQFLFSPVMGALSDRFGRRPVVLISNFGLGFDYVLMALAPTSIGSSSGASSPGSPPRASPPRAPTSRTPRRRRTAPRATACSGRPSAWASWWGR